MRTAAKALELFLAMIVDEASKVTLERGSKRVEAYHLYVMSLCHLLPFANQILNYRKHAVESVEILDFLKELVESVPDPSAGGTIDLEQDGAEKETKKRGKGKKAAAEGGEQPVKRRRKKAEKKEDEDMEPEEEEILVPYARRLQEEDDDYER